jgi:hypothetical protein
MGEIMDADKQHAVKIPAGEQGAGAPGKTIGDVMDAILLEPRRWLGLVGLLVVLSGLAMLVMFVFIRLFHVETSEVRLGGSDSHVVFQRIQESTGNGEYLVVVNPEGWQTTGIIVHSGDHISFSAGGKICIDVNEIWAKVQLRKQYEDQLAQGPHGIKENDPNETRVPEDFFTDQQKQSLVLDRPWIDPDGFSLDVFKPSFRSRRNRYLLPDKPAGGLLAAVKDGSEEPGRQDAFFVGHQYDLVARSEGVLWFTVNDVQYNDPNNRNLFYNDNIGVFWVRIAVKHE